MATVDSSVRTRRFWRNTATGGLTIILLLVLKTVFQESVQPAFAARGCPDVNRPPSTTAISDVAVGKRSGAVAVGWVRDNRAGRRAAAWIARGGRTSQPTILPRVPDDRDQAMLSVTPFANALVAVGRQDGRASAWISDSGMNWKPASGLEKLVGRASVMRAVSYDNQLVAVGWICDKPSEGRKAAVWTSRNARQWKLTRIRSASRFLDVDQERPQAQINSVARFNGRLYAVGVVSATPTDIRPNRVNWEAAVWRSRDTAGEDWEPVDDIEAPGGEGDQFMNGVTAWSGGLVAVGGDGFGQDTEAAVWTSRDGNSWQRVQVDETPVNPFRRPGESSAMTSVAAIGETIVAVGYTERLGGAKSPTTWITKDPQLWPQPDTFSMLGEATSITRQHGAVMEVGWTIPQSRRSPAIGWSKILTLPRSWTWWTAHSVAPRRPAVQDLQELERYDDGEAENDRPGRKVAAVSRSVQGDREHYPSQELAECPDHQVGKPGDLGVSP